MPTREETTQTIEAKRTALKNALDADEIKKDEIISLFNSAVETEENYGSESYRKVHQSKKKYEADIASIGYDSTKHGSLSEYVETLKAPNDKVLESAEYKLKVAELTSANNELNQLREYKSKREGDDKNVNIRDFLTKKLTDANVHENYVEKEVNLMILQNQVDLVGDKVVWKNGDETLTFDDGFKGYMEKDENKKLIKSTQNPGAGTEYKTDDKGKITMTQEQAKALTREQLQDPAVKAAAYDAMGITA